jgi:hypothetical protein
VNRLLRTVRKWSLRLALSLLIAFALVEIGLRLFIGLSPTWSALPNAFREAPVTGFGLAPNIRMRLDRDEMEYHFTFDTNEQGFRGPVPRPRRPGECRLLVLGDSFAFGIGVERDETFSALLESRLKDTVKTPVTVINTGVPSFGTVHELALYRERGPSFDPDAVLLEFFDNDFIDNVKTFRYVDKFLFENPILIAGHPSFTLELLLKQVLGVRPTNHDDSIARTQELLTELRDLASARRQPLLVVRIPVRERTKFAVFPNSWHLPFPDVSGLSAQELMPLLEAAPTTPYLRDLHLNKLGHRIVADAVLPWATEVCRDRAASN